MLVVSLAACSGGGGGNAAAVSGPMPPARASLGPADCVGGSAGGFPCGNVNLLARVGLDELQASSASDLWGWTDPVTGIEYALVGLFDRTAFVDLSDPRSPQVLGFMLAPTEGSPWRDIKVIGDFAYVVADGVIVHGMQIIDLTRLRGIGAPPEFLLPDLVYSGFESAHNIAANPDTRMIYAAATNTCAGGLHVVDVSAPMTPAFAGCFDQEAVHDAQCVRYAGPDPDHQGSDICFGSDEEFFSVIDVTDPLAPVVLDRSVLGDHVFVHQGWLAQDQRFFLLGDELDEITRGHNTRTYVYDVTDLDAMALSGFITHATASIDHNLYVVDDHVFEANYTSGLRVLRLGNLAQAELAEVAFFDTVASSDAPIFAGAWTAFPFFGSGIVIVSDASTGLYVLDPDLDAVADCSDGIDNDLDGVSDLDDPQCASSEDPDEAQ